MACEEDGSGVCALASLLLYSVKWIALLAQINTRVIWTSAMYASSVHTHTHTHISITKIRPCAHEPHHQAQQTKFNYLQFFFCYMFRWVYAERILYICDVAELFTRGFVRAIKLTFLNWIRRAPPLLPRVCMHMYNQLKNSMNVVMYNIYELYRRGAHTHVDDAFVHFSTYQWILLCVYNKYVQFIFSMYDDATPWYDERVVFENWCFCMMCTKMLFE